jgi:hypothetical protein
VSSGEVSTDSNLTAVNYIACENIIDVLPAVCTMDYIGLYCADVLQQLLLQLKVASVLTVVLFFNS